MAIRSSIFPSNALRKHARFAATIGALALVSACASDQPGVAGPSSRADASREGVPSVDASREGVPSNEGLVSPVWQQKARDLVAGAGFSPLAAGRAYPLLGVAQYLAVQRAEAAVGVPNTKSADASGNGIGSGGRLSQRRSSRTNADRDDRDDRGLRDHRELRESGQRLETDRGAVAGASVVVLSYLFPASVQMLEDLVTAQANAGPGQPQAAFAAGEAIGRAAGAEMVAHGRVDGFSNPNTAVAPLGPGFWTSSTDPATPTAGGQLPGMTRWFLTSANQFRLGPPPTFGGAAFNAVLAEIRQISDTRTAEQIQIANFWALNPGTPTPPGFWLDQASQEIAAHGLSEREATHVFALVSSTVADALIGCWDSKLTYWFIRPWNADPGITTLATVGRPNHPSYPSGHSCVSSAAAEVLSTFFPERRTDLEAMVIQAGLSRMYAGIHYRTDIEGGQNLGRSVALFTIAADRSGKSVLSH